MAAKKKYKKLTNAEKKYNREFKQRLVEEGIIAPPKKPLNRKKYIEAAKETWLNHEYDELYYIMEALYLVLGLKERGSHAKVSSEAVGAAKVIFLMHRLDEFRQKVKAEGRTQYTVGERYDFIKDILDE